MEENIDTGQPPKKRSTLRRIGSSTMAFSVLLSQVTPALATIDNTATASGTYNASTTTSNASTVNVTVAGATPTMTVVKTVLTAPTIASGTDATISDAGDKITYQYVVKNTGNVTITNALPVDTGPKFNGLAGTGTMAAFVATTPSTTLPVTLVPNASQTYTAIYTMSQLDIDRSAGVTGNVTNSATATGTPASGTLAAVTPSTTTTTVPAGPKLLIAKTAVPTTGVQVGDTIVYTYTVSNTGNVPFTNVTINDTHEGAAVPPGTIIGETLVSDGPLAPGTASTDTVVNNGTWSTLQPGAVIKFTWNHIVTQAEFDGG
jgi:uncharacterized repeat protein (TIGR01451 family)